jgi:prephenate dehydrogenase
MKKIVIIGVGLIGGSFALAHKRAGGVQVIGIDRSVEVLDAATQRGVIDAHGNFASALKDADIALIAIPVRQIPATLAAMLPHLEERTLLMDAGSTKQDVTDAAREALGARISQFVAAHPIAGRETSGVSSADAALFENKNVVLTPLAENSSAMIERATVAWRVCGANPILIQPATHDAIFAAVSHLPHMLAFALVDELAARPNAKTLFSFAASGFRDFTRIAGSSPEMWRDIALNNRQALLAEMDAYLGKANALRELIANADAQQLEQLMQRSRDARSRWLAGELDSFRDESV